MLHRNSTWAQGLVESALVLRDNGMPGGIKEFTLESIDQILFHEVLKAEYDHMIYLWDARAPSRHVTVDALSAYRVLSAVIRFIEV
jgi:hypothetical protein